MGAKDVHGEVARHLWSLTAGNPRHLTEAFQFMRELGLLETRSGAVHFAAPGPAWFVPWFPQPFERLHAVRSDVLCNPLLQTRLGGALDLGLAIERTSNRPESHQRPVPARRATQRDPGTAPAHRRIADGLEALPGKDPRRSLGRLAIHRELAGQWALAMPIYARVAAAAMADRADQATALAIAGWRRMVEHLPDGQVPPAAERAQMTLLELVAVARVGPASEVLPLARRFSMTDMQHLSARQRAWSDYWVGTAMARLWRVDQATARLRHVPDSDLPAGHRARAQIAQAHLAALQGETAEANRAVRAAESLLAPGDARGLARLSLVRGALLESLGDPRSAAAHFSAAATGDGDTRAWAGLGRARCALWLDERARAALLAAQVEVRLEPSLAAATLLTTGLCHAWDERWVRARGPLERALQLAERAGNDLLAAEALLYLGTAVACTEDPSAGLALCMQGLDLVRRPLVFIGQFLMLTAAQAAGERERAHRAYLQVMASEHPLRATPLLQAKLRAMRAPA
jgi:tetratricopeptide (TPR) repeat protein